MRIAVLGPGGVGGLVAGALERAGTRVTVVARESTVDTVSAHGLQVDSVSLGRFVVHPHTVSCLEEPVDALIVATKAAGLIPALDRIDTQPALVLPLLNGLDHLTVLRERFPSVSVPAATIRVEADRPEPGVVVHTSHFLLVEMASREPRAEDGMQALALLLSDAGVGARVRLPMSARSEAEVMWSKLVRLNALACTTSAFEMLLGEIRATPELRDELVAAIEESCAVARAEGALDADPATALAELTRAHETLGSSMQRDIAAGRTLELDAIPGAVLRAAARHRLECPTIERLVAMIAVRAGIPAPAVR
jgi:2-dehydropantoate 2-reductase